MEIHHKMIKNITITIDSDLMFIVSIIDTIYFMCLLINCVACQQSMVFHQFIQLTIVFDQYYNLSMKLYHFSFMQLSLFRIYIQ